MAANLDLALKLVRAGPSLQGEKDVLNFTSYFDTVFAIQLDAEGIRLVSALMRSKITGVAQDLLTANPESVSWTEIKQLLQVNLLDNRSTIQLMNALLTSKCIDSVQTFYEYLQRIRALINVKYGFENPESTAAVRLEYAATVNRLAANHFKNSLHEPLRAILAATTVQTLEEAISILRSTPYNLRRKQSNRNSNENYNQPTRNNNRGQSNANCDAASSQFNHRGNNNRHRRGSNYYRGNRDSRQTNNSLADQSSSGQSSANRCGAEPMDVDRSRQSY